MWAKTVAFPPENLKRDQNLQFTPLSETTSIPITFIWESASPPPPPGLDHDDKTEFMIIGTRQQLRKLQAMNIKVGSSEIKPSSQVRNLGCWLDSNLYMRDHITNVCKATITLDALRSIYRETSYDLLWYTHSS